MTVVSVDIDSIPNNILYSLKCNNFHLRARGFKPTNQIIIPRWQYFDDNLNCHPNEKYPRCQVKSLCILEIGDTGGWFFRVRNTVQRGSGGVCDIGHDLHKAISYYNQQLLFLI